MTARQSQRLLEQLPPHAIEAEMCVLGSMFVDCSVIDDVVQILKPADFYKSCNTTIFEIMLGCYNKNRAVDGVLVQQILIDKDLLTSIGGQAYLLEVIKSVPTASNAKHYAVEVRSKALLRGVITIAGTMLEQAYESKPDQPEEIIASVESSLFALQQQEQTSEIIRIDESFGPALESLKPELLNGSLLKSGFLELDEIVQFRPAEYIIIGARPSMGKTALALQLAMKIAQQDKPVGFFSVEMGIRQLAFRVLCVEAGVASHSINRARYLGETNRDRLTNAAGDLMPTELYIDESGSLTVPQLRSKARRMVSQHGIKILFIDYLQLLKLGERTEKRYVEVGMISHAMKALSKELVIPVVCLSQLNRTSELRRDHKPTMSDLRESGDLEQDADIVMLLHREDEYHKSETDYTKTNVAELIVAKHRSGPTGIVKLTWLAETMQFATYGDPSLHGDCPI